MKKRMVSVLLTVALAAAMLSGCGDKKSAESPAPAAKEEAPAEEQTEEEAVEPEAEVEAKRPQPMVAYCYDYIASDDGQKTLVSYSNSDLLISEESAADFPELAENLKKKMEESDAEAKKSLEEDASYAKDAYKEYPDTFEYGPWESTRDVLVMRADSKVLSAASNFYSYSGGAHGIYGTFGLNYEVDSGKEITADMAFADRSRLTGLLKKKLYADYPDLTEEFDSFEAENTFKQYESGEYEYEYTLEPNCVSFYFGPYTFASYAAGAQTLEFTYDELSGVINEKYVPDEDVAYVTRSSAVDMDGDGDLEHLYSYIQYPDGDESYGKIKVSVNDGEKEFDLKTDVLGTDVDQYLVKTGSGKMFLLVSGAVENDYKVTTICELSKDKLKEMDTVWYNTWYRSLDDEGTHYANYVWTDPDALPMTEHMDILATFGGEKTYKMSDKGEFSSDDEYFMVPQGSRKYMVLHTVKDVKADCINEDGEVITEDMDIPAGTDLYLYRTDGATDGKESVIDCRIGSDDDGAKLIRLHVTNDYPRLVNGIDQEELFESLYYAG